jgi:hypothetical protein
MVLGAQATFLRSCSRPSMSLDVYSHVMPADEIADERFQAVIGA